MEWKVCVVDDFADQIIGINTDDLGSAGAAVGYGVTAPISNAVIPGSGSTTPFSGHIKGIITSVNDSASSDSTITVKVVSRVSTQEKKLPWIIFQ